MNSLFHHPSSNGTILLFTCVLSFFSFQFETETENTKLRRDVFSEGNVSSVGTPTAIVSLMSGQEEMFAFRRAVSHSHSKIHICFIS